MAPKRSLLQKVVKRTLEEKKREKRQKILTKNEKDVFEYLYQNKRYATECYNEPCTDEEWSRLNTLRDPDCHNVVDWSKELTEAEQILPRQMGFNVKPVGGVECIIQFMEAVEFCEKWQTLTLKQLGWLTSPVEYNPIVVSHSTDEVLEATLEWHKMVVKQGQRWAKRKGDESS